MPSESIKSSQNSWKARRARRAKSKKQQEDKNPQPLKEKEQRKYTSKCVKKETSKEKDEGESSKMDLGGFVMAEKHMETLDALLQAYEARLKPLKTLEERWRLYLDPQIEARRLDL